MDFQEIVYVLWTGHMRVFPALSLGCRQWSAAGLDSIGKCSSITSTAWVNLSEACFTGTTLSHWIILCNSCRYQSLLGSNIDRCRGCASDLRPDMMKPAFPAKSDLPPTWGGGVVVKNKGRLPEINFGVFFLAFFICCQKLDLLPKAWFVAGFSISGGKSLAHPLQMASLFQRSERRPLADRPRKARLFRYSQVPSPPPRHCSLWRSYLWLRGSRRVAYPDDRSAHLARSAIPLALSSILSSPILYFLSLPALRIPMGTCTYPLKW